VPRRRGRTGHRAAEAVPSVGLGLHSPRDRLGDLGHQAIAWRL
jgi:hypothetical protein